jgi:hypothetical protein
MSPLIECHAHVLPDTALARFPAAASPRYVTAERRVLSRMLDAQDAQGITHALVSDSFFMETSAEALPGPLPSGRGSTTTSSPHSSRVIRNGSAGSAAWTPGRARPLRASSSAWSPRWASWERW